MPKLNKFGETVGGVGLVGVYLKRNPQTAIQTVAQLSGEVAFLDNDNIIFQDCRGANAVITRYNITTNIGNLFDDAGANKVYGGGGNYILEVSGQSLRSNLPAVSGMRAWHVSSFGYLAFCRDNSGKNFALYDPNGIAINDVQTGPIQQLRLFGNVGAIWTEYGGIIKNFNAGHNIIQIPNDPTDIVTPVLVGTDLYFLESLYSGRLVIRKSDSTIGKVVATFVSDQQGLFAPDVIFHEDLQEFDITWGNNQGELPDNLVNIKLDELIQNLNKTIIIPDPSILLPKFPNKRWMGNFHSYTKTWGNTKNPFGNCTIVTNGGSIKEAWEGSGAPIICGFDEYDASLDNIIIGYYTEGKDFDALKAEVDFFKTVPEKPILAVLDNDGDFVTLPTWWNKNLHWLGVELYRKLGESFETYKARIVKSVNLFYTQDTQLCAINMLYQMQDKAVVTLPDEVLEIQDFNAAIIENPRWIGVFNFTDMRQGSIPTDPPITFGGMNLWPKMKEFGKRLFNACIERPNRYDYWVPTNVDPKIILQNKLQQSTNNIWLTDDEKKYLLACMENQK